MRGEKTHFAPLPRPRGREKKININSNLEILQAFQKYIVCLCLSDPSQQIKQMSVFGWLVLISGAGWHPGAGI